MKRLLSVLLIASVAMFTLVGCGTNAKNDAKSNTINSEKSDKQNESSESEKADNNKVDTSVSETDTTSSEADTTSTGAEQSGNGWPSPSEYGIVTLMDGTQIYMSSIDVAEIEQIVAEDTFPQKWWDIMKEMNANSYNISGFWCNCGQGASFICGTDNVDDIVKTQQLLEEIASTYGYTILYRWAER